MILNDLGTLKRGKSKHRPRNDATLYGGKYPFIQTGDIKSSELHVLSHSQTYNEKGLCQSHLWGKGTLCITIAANIAETAILSYDACFPDSVVGFEPYPEISDVYYVKYLLDYMKAQMQQISKGTTQDNLSVDKMLSFQIDAPDVFTQQKQVQPLLLCDLLIENNNRRIAILEEIAQRLYRNEILKTDAVCLLGELVRFRRGKTITKATISKGNVPVVAGGIQPAYYHNRANAKAPILTVSASGANAGYVNLYHVDIWASDCSFIDANDTANVFYYYTVMKELQSQITFMQRGSAQPHVYPDDISRLEIPALSQESIEGLNKIFADIFNSIGNLKRKNEVLRKTRDHLLPRLMSGDIDVSKIET